MLRYANLLFEKANEPFYNMQDSKIWGKKVLQLQVMFTKKMLG
jgi:hypothetical protein